MHWSGVRPGVRDRAHQCAVTKIRSWTGGCGGLTTVGERGGPSTRAGLDPRFDWALKLGFQGALQGDDFTQPTGHAGQTCDPWTTFDLSSSRRHGARLSPASGPCSFDIGTRGLPKPNCATPARPLHDGVMFGVLITNTTATATVPFAPCPKGTDRASSQYWLSKSNILEAQNVFALPSETCWELNCTLGACGCVCIYV